jgi:hypothetical protein
MLAVPLDEQLNVLLAAPLDEQAATKTAIYEALEANAFFGYIGLLCQLLLALFVARRAYSQRRLGWRGSAAALLLATDALGWFSLRKITFVACMYTLMAIHFALGNAFKVSLIVRVLPFPSTSWARCPNAYFLMHRWFSLAAAVLFLFESAITDKYTAAWSTGLPGLYYGHLGALIRVLLFVGGLLVHRWELYVSGTFALFLLVTFPFHLLAALLWLLGTAFWCAREVGRPAWLPLAAGAALLYFCGAAAPTTFALFYVLVWYRDAALHLLKSIFMLFFTIAAMVLWNPILTVDAAQALHARWPPPPARAEAAPSRRPPPIETTPEALAVERARNAEAQRQERALHVKVCASLRLAAEEAAARARLAEADRKTAEKSAARERAKRAADAARLAAEDFARSPEGVAAAAARDAAASPSLSLTPDTARAWQAPRVCSIWQRTQ